MTGAPENTTKLQRIGINMYLTIFKACRMYGYEGYNVMRINLNDVHIEHNPHERCFEAIFNGQRIGLADYGLTGTNMTFTHTEVDPAYQGQGVADTLIHTALEYAKAQEFTVTPICWFVARFIQRHPEYQTLIS